MLTGIDDKTERALRRVRDVSRANSIEMRMVGGCVRDHIIGKKCNDIDLATPSRPEVVVRAFSNRYSGLDVHPTGIKHGTVTVVVDGVPFEVTTLRIDKKTDGRRALVEFTDDWAMDAARRDFTCNAMYMDFDGRVYDYFNGRQDLMRGILRFVGDPNDRIKEDYLRILRFFRFYSRMDKPDSVPPMTVDAITKNARGLTEISGERVWSELIKILAGPSRMRSLVAMHITGVASYIGLPVPTDGILYIQNRPDASWLHSLAALVRTNEELDTLRKRWKIDNNSFRLLDFVIKNRKLRLTKDVVMEMVVKGESKDNLSQLAGYQGDRELMSYISTLPNVPKFPITGHDAKSLGLSGAEIGRALTAVRQHWIDSSYIPGRDELLVVLRYISSSLVG
jgi:tRNA nucleotidyltransferase/poly(A) polymerase